MKTAMHKAALIDQANKELREQPCYQEGFEITDARMEKHVLVMESNTPTAPESFDWDALNEFAKYFGDKYTLIG